MRKDFQERMRQRAREKAATKKTNKSNKDCYVCSNSLEEEETKVQKLWTFCRDCNLWCCNECLPLEFKSDKKQFICNNCALEEEDMENARNRFEQEMREKSTLV